LRDRLSAAERKASTERFVRLVVMSGGAALSLSLGDCPAWQDWCAAERVAMVPRVSAHRSFAQQFAKYNAEVAKLIGRLRSPAIVECGPEGVPVDYIRRPADARRAGAIRVLAEQAEGAPPPLPSRSHHPVCSLPLDG
jgi:hypothetical protein